MARTIGDVALVAAAILLTGPLPLSAQQGQPRPAQPQAGAPANPGAAAAAPALAMPDGYKLNMMIRTAVIALNQANLTGNYTVLRDLGATSFRISNDASRLAEISADLRKRKLDLSPVLFFMPKLMQQPQINERGVIRLVGYFETAPERINFDVYYVFETGQWRLFGIGVLLSPAVDATAALPQNNAPTSATPPGAAPAAGPARPAAANAGRTSAKPPAKSSESAAPASPGKAAVENKTTNNTARIQLGAPAAGEATASPQAAPEGAAQSEAEAPAAKEKSKDGFLSFW
jgi:hypothetical protein